MTELIFLLNYSFNCDLQF